MILRREWVSRWTLLRLRVPFPDSLTREEYPFLGPPSFLSPFFCEVTRLRVT